MNVKELMAELKELDPQTLVVLAHDEEGNGYSPLDGIGANEIYVAETSRFGELMLVELTDESREEGYSEDDVAKEGEGVKAVVLWPL